MAHFSPGAYKKSLQEKVKGFADVHASKVDAPVTIKNNSQESFSQQAASYAANEMRQINSSIQSPRSTANLPSGSIMHKSVHERMQSFVKNQNGK